MLKERFKMDWILFASFIITFFVVVLNVLFFLINSYIYPTINPSDNVIINAGLAHNGKDGVDGNDGYNGPIAINGNAGFNGNQGLNGRKGNVGASGPKGNPGLTGQDGQIGQPGAIGEKGLPSNSNVSIINRFDMQNTDSYTLNDVFSFENIQYQVTMYANVESNSRFVLKFGEDITLPQTGFVTNITPGTLPVSVIDGGSFYSNLRIAIGYGRGLKDSKSRSDDTIFYLSPPISRRSFLFRYKLLNTLPDEFQFLGVKYPIRPLNNTKNFYFFDSTVPITETFGDELNLWNYHLFKGLGKYEIVVNTFPPLPSNYIFNYRIVEEFTRTNSLNFALPQIVFPFNSNMLTFKKSGETKINISNRFDLDRVVERSYDTDNIPWIQTQKKFVEIVTGEENNLIPFDNTFKSLKDDDLLTQTSLQKIQYYQYPNGVVNLNADNLALPLKGTFKNVGTNFSVNLEAVFGMRNYVPKVPLDKFKNNEKFYMKMKFLSHAFPVPTADYIFIYGEEFSFELVDFQTVYSKSIYIAPSYRANPDINQHITTFEPEQGQNAYPCLVHSMYSEIEVGYTQYSTNDRYTTTVLLQGIEDIDQFCYYFNIPLYGYKKK